jgi:hypothetical protein
VKSLIYRTILLASIVGIVGGTFTATKAWACGKCNFSAPGLWFGDCFYTNNTGCVEPTPLCQGTHCIVVRTQVKSIATLCTLNVECANGGDSGLGTICGNVGP